MSSSSCDVCQKSANQRCGGCHQIFYCSKEHQKTGWKSHKTNCRPFKIVESDDVLGRYLVTTKPIKIGEKILKERPIIYGPSQETIPVCLGCGKAITEENNRPCGECGWPMCSEICQKNPSHLPECRYTVQRGEKVSIHNFGITHPIYQCITVLRCLYQKQFLREIWNKLDTLQSHCEDRKHTQRYKNERIQVAEFIRRFFKLDFFNEDDIMRVCGIVLVNSHEIPLTDPPYIAIYEACSMFEHSCKANCTKSFTNDGSILITAGEDIPKGEHLSICYTDALWGTPNRRHFLYDTKFFSCTCARCSDVTEFGTYFSAMRCQEKSCDGFLLPKTFLSRTDNTKESDWSCNKCKKSVSCFSVQDVFEKLGCDLAEIAKNDEESLKIFINSSQNYISSNHFYLTEARLNLVQSIGQDSHKGALLATSEDDLDLKATLASQLLSLTSKIAPAEKRLRGILLFELHAAVAEMGRRSGEQDVMQMRLIEAKQYLIDCIEFLKNEPSCLPEGVLVRQAKENLKNIDVVLEKIHQCSPI